MASIEPGIYRIINVRDKTAITVPASSTNTVVGWKTPNQPGQQWLLKYSEGGYHLSDCVYGRYMVVDGTKWGSKVYLGRYPILWEILVLSATENIHVIKLAGHNLVLDSHGGQDGAGIHVWPQYSQYLQRLWRLERLGGLPSDEPGPARFGTTENDSIIAQMVEQLIQKDKQIAELTGQLASQSQTIADQEREIHNQKRQIEERDQQPAQANREVEYMLDRVVQREEPPTENRAAGANISSVGVAQGEVKLLRLEDKIKHLESLVNQLLDKGISVPNNMS